MKGRNNNNGSPIHYIYFFCAFVLGVSFAFSEDMDTRLAFTVGNIGITVYETTKNAAQAVDTFRYNNESFPSREWMREWLKGFIERSYFLESARAKGYFEKSSIETDVESMARNVVTQDGGLLEKDLVKEVSVSEAEMRDAYEKVKRKYTILLIVFDDRNALARIAGRDTVKVTPERFREWFATVKSPDQLDSMCGEFTLSWPFWNYPGLEAAILNLPENCVAGPISTGDGINYIFMEKRDAGVSPPPYDTAMKNNFRNIVRGYKECVIMERFRETVKNNTVISIQPRAFEDVFELFRNSGGVASFHEEYKGNDAPLFSCRYNRRLLHMNAGGFLKDCGLMIRNEKIDSRPALRKRIIQKAYALCAYVEAEKRGLTKTEQFILDRKNYANALVFDAYTKSELVDKHSVTESDMRKEYSGHQERYKDGESVTSVRFLFNSMDAARKGSGELFRQRKESGKGKDWMQKNMDGLVSVTTDFTITHDSKALPPATMKILLKILPGQITVALDLGDGKYGVFVKESETGTRIKSFDEVKDEVQKNVAEDRLKQNRAARLEELRRKYPVKFVIPNETLLKSIFDSRLELSSAGK